MGNYLVSVILDKEVLSYPVEGEHKDAVKIADHAFLRYPDGTICVTRECEECGEMHPAYCPCDEC